MSGVKEEPAFFQPPTDPMMVGVVLDAREAFRHGEPGHSLRENLCRLIFFVQLPS